MANSMVKAEVRSGNVFEMVVAEYLFPSQVISCVGSNTDFSLISNPAFLSW